MVAAGADPSLLPTRATGIVDATGLEARHVRRYDVWRTGYRGVARRRWPTLTWVIDAHTHLMAGGVVSRGPSQDSPQFPAAIRRSATRAPWDRLMADTADDPEHTHQWYRDPWAIRSTVIPLHPRRQRDWPNTRDRRQRQRRLFHRVYRQRCRSNAPCPATQDAWARLCPLALGGHRSEHACCGFSRTT
jgi:hypothetical protein